MAELCKTALLLNSAQFAFKMFTFERVFVCGVNLGGMELVIINLMPFDISMKKNLSYCIELELL